MSFSTYCRECATHFADQCCKKQHVAVAHYGITPPNPEISEDLFYIINFHVPEVRARTCPVCLIHFANLGECIRHVDNNHPTPTVCSLLRPTKEVVIYEWERLVNMVFPGAFSLHRKTWHITREQKDTIFESEASDDNCTITDSDTSDDDSIYFKCDIRMELSEEK